MPSLLATSRELVQTHFGKGIWQFAKLSVRKLKWLLTVFIGRGPYRIRPFAELCAARRDPRTHIYTANRDSTGILHQEETEWVRYPSGRDLFRPKDSPSKSVLGPPHRPTLYCATKAGVVAEFGAVYFPESRTAVSETVLTHDLPSAYDPAICAPLLPRPTSLPGLSLCLASPSNYCFFHLMTEELPKLWLARDFLPMVDHYLVGEGGEMLNRWLALTDIPPEKVVRLHARSHFHCEQLLFTNELTVYERPTAWLLNAIRQVYHAPAPVKPTRWLWISRRDAIRRQIVWEDEFLAAFPRFEKIEMSGLQPREQIALFSSAAVVAGPHGAGFANLAFAPPGGTFVEILPDDNDFTRAYQNFCACNGWRHGWVEVPFGDASCLGKLIPAVRDFIEEYSTS
jgi:capsular polysaccharide biosynthesis protein